MYFEVERETGLYIAQNQRTILKGKFPRWTYISRKLYCYEIDHLREVSLWHELLPAQQRARAPEGRRVAARRENYGTFGRYPSEDSNLWPALSFRKPLRAGGEEL